MDEQTTTATEPATTPVVRDLSATSLSQRTSADTRSSPSLGAVSADATTGRATPDPVQGDSPVAEPPQAEPAPVPETAQVEAPPETGTAQMVGNEPLALVASAVASAEAQAETPTPEPVPVSQHDPTPQETPASSPVPAQAQVIVTPAPQSRLRDFLTKAAEVINGRKTKKLDKIMQVIEKKGKISNDEVEKLLRVSDATATRYLSELEKQGKIKQEGKTGKSVSYTKI